MSGFGASLCGMERKLNLKKISLKVNFLIDAVAALSYKRLCKRKKHAELYEEGQT